MYYTKEQGFTPERLTADSVELTDDEWQNLVIGQGQGKVIALMDSQVVLSDPPELTAEQVAVQVQTVLRQKTGVATEQITILEDAVSLEMATPAEQASLTAWRKYRVLLNRVPAQPGYPLTVDWPVVPE